MPRPKALFLAAGAVLLVVVFFYTSRASNYTHYPLHFPHHAPPSSSSSNSTSPLPHYPSVATPSQKASALHLLTVATSNDVNLCRLLLSAAVLSYPPAVIIDWEGQGEFNAKESHLAKIIGPLRYFESLPASRDDDIVVLVDGYDVVFQLGPDVLLRRYHDTIKAKNAQLEAHFGAQHVKKYGTYNSLLYGPDVLCYPIDFHRPACWLVPESTLPRDAFGKETDKNREHTRPRWLNSGTLMGPLSDVRRLFVSAHEKLNKTFDPEYKDRNSDQMYLADVFGDQEYARMTAGGGKVENPFPDAVPDDIKKETRIPKLEKGQVAEHHIAIDYESRLFQTVAYYYKVLIWNTFSDSSNNNNKDTNIADLPEDVLQAKPPYRTLGSSEHPQLTSKTWRDVSLLVNKITKNVMPVVHFTGQKGYRDQWWDHFWFYPQGRQLLKAEPDHGVIAEIDGVAYTPYIPFGKTSSARGDAWSDKGDLLPWQKVCKEHEGKLFKQ